MKRILLFGLVFSLAAGTLWAQLGSRPAGFSEYRSDEFELTFFYPDGWFVSEDDGALSIVNREALLDQSAMDTPDIRPGDTIMVIGIMPAFFMEMMGVPVDTISAILDGMFENIVSTNDGTLVNSKKELLEFGGRQVAAITFDDSSQEASGIFMVAREQEDVIMFAVAYGFRNSLDANRQDLAQVVASAEFTGSLEAMMQ